MSLMTVAALPIISMLAGVAALFIDPKTGGKKVWILIVLLIAVALGTIAGGVSDDSAKDSLRETVNNQSSSLKSQGKVLENLSGKADDILSRLSTFGLSPAATSQIRQSVSADASRSAVLSSVIVDSAAAKVTVAYYPKEVDGPVVINALKQGGFQVVSRQGNPANAALATNAIWVGDSVTVDQAKFVALTLIRAGVSVVSVRRGFKRNPAAKKNMIEVGTDQSLFKQQVPAYTVDQINAMKVIPTDNSAAMELST